MGLHHPLADKLPHLGEVMGKKPQEMDQRDRNMFSSQSNELQLSCSGHVFRLGGGQGPLERGKGRMGGGLQKGNEKASTLSHMPEIPKMVAS